MKEIINKIPIIRSIYNNINRVLFNNRFFPGSEIYWNQRYNSRGNSGGGSYNQLAEFKAETINSFIKEYNVTSILEYGCGDGNQLKLAKYPLYIGFDVSIKAIELCKDIFQDDKTKHFRLMNEYNGETAQLTLSLDVIYHLIEDEVYNSYMEVLFNSSERFVIIYSSNCDGEQNYHEKPRQFTEWIVTNKPYWKLKRYMKNIFPYNVNSNEGSLSDFYIYEYENT